MIRKYWVVAIPLLISWLGLDLVSAGESSALLTKNASRVDTRVFLGYAGYMRLEHYPPEKLRKEILEIVGRHLDLKKYKVFFFGSRVEGKGTDRSDIDVGIEGPEPVPFEAWEAIREELDNLPTLYKIDLVDFREVTPAFYRVAKEHLETLN